MILITFLHHTPCVDDSFPNLLYATVLSNKGKNELYFFKE